MWAYTAGHIMPLYFLAIWNIQCLNTKQVNPSSNTSDEHCGGTQFEFQVGSQISCHWVFCDYPWSVLVDAWVVP